MKKLSFLFVALALFFISNNLFSQSWLPKPVESVYADAIIGTWTSQPYEYMGSMHTDLVTCSKILNGQYIEIDVKRTDDQGFTYEGKEIIIPAADGNMKGIYFDIFGKDKSTSYTGTTDGNKIILNGASPVGEGTREIIINGNSMTQNVTFVMTDDSGAKSPEQKISIIYSK